MALCRITRQFHRSLMSIQWRSKWSTLPYSRVCLTSSVREVSFAPKLTNHATFLQLGFPTPSLRSYSTSSDGSGEKMTFEEYRKLRKSLKVRTRVAGLPMAFLGMGISSFVNVHYVTPNMFEMTPEEVKPILGLDPIVFAALCGVASGMTGFIIGGVLFNTTWKLLFRKKAAALQERENDFLERIQKYRFSDVSHYDDDYYADKVMTLSDYRQWVRQQEKRQEQLASAAAVPSSSPDVNTQSTTNTQSR